MVLLFVSFIAHGQNDPAKWDPDQLQSLSFAHTFGKLRIAPSQKTLLNRAIRKALQRWLDTTIDYPAPRSAEQVIAEVRIDMIDLDDDRIPEVVAQASDLQGGCSATGNCPIWIFKQTIRGYERLLESQGERIKILASNNEGFHDFLVGVHESASEQTLLVYRFRAGEYRRHSCYDRAILLGGGIRVTPCK